MSGHSLLDVLKESTDTSAPVLTGESFYNGLEAIGGLPLLKGNREGEE